jgi:hypothetical protein
MDGVVRQCFSLLVCYGRSQWLPKGYLTPSTLKFANPKLTTEQAKASLKPLTDYIATITSSLTGGSNTIYEVPSFYKWETDVVLPTFNVSNVIEALKPVRKLIFFSQTGTGHQGALGSRFIHKNNFATADKRAELLDAILELASKTTIVGIDFTVPYNFKAEAGATSVHPGYVPRSYSN